MGSVRYCVGVAVDVEAMVRRAQKRRGFMGYDIGLDWREETICMCGDAIGEVYSLKLS